MRKRFNRVEQILIENSPGRDVEWQNVTQWLPGRLAGPIVREADGWETVLVENRRSTRTISAGRRIPVRPGHIRAARGAG